MNSRGFRFQAHLGKVFEAVTGTRLTALVKRIPYGVNLNSVREYVWLRYGRLN